MKACTSQVLLRKASALLITLEVAVAKIFLSGFGWQAAVIISRAKSTSFVFFTAAGAGDALGVVLGSFVVALTHACGKLERGLCTPGFMLALGSFLSGFVWQPLVNALYHLNVTFEIGMLVTGCGCGMAFLIGLTATRALMRRATCKMLIKDATLSVSVAGATAFFVGTDTAWHGNWLQGLVGQRTGDSAMFDCLHAGLSTCIGFCACGGLLIVFVPTHLLWTSPEITLLGTVSSLSNVDPLLPVHSLRNVVAGTENLDTDVWTCTSSQQRDGRGWQGTANRKDVRQDPKGEAEGAS
jgi:hypothetical protein